MQPDFYLCSQVLKFTAFHGLLRYLDLNQLVPKKTVALAHQRKVVTIFYVMIAAQRKQTEAKR
jgi:hypothetical protein